MADKISKEEIEELIEKFDRWDSGDVVIRLSKITIENFKGVVFGEIDLKHGKKSFKPHEESDILGIYGQNGSGKTTVLDAIRVLYTCMKGSAREVCNCKDCISSVTGNSKLTFEMEYFDKDDIKTIRYEVTLSHDDKGNGIVEAERFSVAGLFEGKKIKMQPIIDTYSENYGFGPASKHKYFITREDKSIFSVVTEARDKGESVLSLIDEFAFKRDILNDYTKLLSNTRIYFLFYISFVTNDGIDEIDNIDYEPEFYKYGLSLVTNTKTYYFNVGGDIHYSFWDDEDDYDYWDGWEFENLENHFKALNMVLEQLIPGIKVDIDMLSNPEFGGPSVTISHNGIPVAITEESRGIKRLISEMSMLIKAYNDERMILVIDEFDSGIFEFLIGELLEIFEESGKGQLIFTSHNLRPLEVLNKRCICFTTTNPENRYYRMKGVGHTYNLRNMYFREILLNEQDEELYKAAKKHKLTAAFRQAGKVGKSNGEEA